MITLITVATHAERGWAQFEQSCETQGIEPVVLGWGSRWQGLGMKLHLQWAWLSQRPADDVVLFSDAYDAILADTPAQAERRWRGMGSPGLLMAAERNCAPFDERAVDYPEAPNEYRYLNCGGWIGRAGAMRRILEEIKVWRLPSELNDQGVFTDYHLSHPGRITLDHNCEIFQCLFHRPENGEVSHMEYFDAESNPLAQPVNRLTGTKPALLHANGAQFHDEMYHWQAALTNTGARR